MIDLAEQLRTYVDAIAAPVGLGDLHLPETRPRRRGAVAALVAAALVLAIGVAVFLLRDRSDSESIQPARRPAVPLTVKASALCTEALQPQATLLPPSRLVFGAVLNRGGTVCVGDDGSTLWTTFLRQRDGRGGVAGGLPNLEQVGVQQLSGWHSRTTNLGMTFAAVAPRVARVRYTFCDGSFVDATPMNDGELRFVGVAYDKRLGFPADQGFEASGRAASPALGGMRITPSGKLRSCQIPNAAGR